MENCYGKIGCGITCDCNILRRNKIIKIKRYSIFTPPYRKDRIEEDENGDLCKFEDVKEFLDQTIDGVPPLPSEERVIIDPIWREKYSGKEIK